MKNWKCKLGFHKYTHLIHQVAHDIVGFFSGVPIRRDVRKCKNCGKLKYIPYDIATDLHLEDSLNWEPKIKT